jgi:hypothetical protein
MRWARAAARVMRRENRRYARTWMTRVAEPTTQNKPRPLSQRTVARPAKLAMTARSAWLWATAEATWSRSA